MPVALPLSELLGGLCLRSAAVEIRGRGGNAATQITDAAALITRECDRAALRPFPISILRRFGNAVTSLFRPSSRGHRLRESRLCRLALSRVSTPVLRTVGLSLFSFQMWPSADEPGYPGERGLETFTPSLHIDRRRSLPGPYATPSTMRKSRSAAEPSTFLAAS